MDKIEKRKEILRKSIDLMYLQGYHGTNVRELAKEAGLGKSTFYNYFVSKEEYAIFALDYYLEVLGYERFQLLEDTTVRPLERIKNFYRSKIDNMVSLEFKLGCFIGNLTQEMADVNEPISAATEQLHNKISSRILKCIIAEQKDFEYKPVLAPEVLADYIINSWQGALIRMKASKSRVPLDEFYEVLSKVLLKSL